MMTGKTKACAVHRVGMIDDYDYDGVPIYYDFLLTHET
jgi:hypothetical protein